eukprot:CAMPEP_0194536602 /NCGR_PEP_ID=MMETSP0253-20130528/75590_1 /TAXON_ID=2966 /ORGANISM="Noctiluca scintillans" /LENGTH=458 /DNA_ID=CAMNT_0039382541 /DNA_START=71 /DNA_END=1444 /DNA_ORIENTATION=-
MSLTVHLAAATLVVTMGGLLFGYTIGITSNVVSPGQLRCESGHGGTWTTVEYGQCYELSWREIWLTYIIGIAIASALCAAMSDAIGRRKEMQISAALYCIGALTTAFAPVLWGMFLGFGIYGAGMGFAMHAAPMYIVEISPAEVRCCMVALIEAVIVVGAMLGYSVGSLCVAIPNDGWRIMCALSGVLALVMGVGTCFVPRSPRWLLLRAAGDITYASEAEEALKFLRRGDVGDELMEIYYDMNAASGGNESVWGHKKALMISCITLGFRLILAQPLWFAVPLFRIAGFGRQSESLSYIGVGCVQLVSTLLALWLASVQGCRASMKVGILMLVVAHVVMAVALLSSPCVLLEGSCSARQVAVAIFAFIFSTAGYQIGLGSFSWLLVSEVFPTKVRGSGVSTVLLCFASSSFVVVFFEWSRPWDVLVFVAFAAALLFVHVVVPETRGMTLEEIGADLLR